MICGHEGDGLIGILGRIRGRLPIGSVDQVNEIQHGRRDALAVTVATVTTV